MRRILKTFVFLIWGLWFGGVITLFIAVTSLFAALPKQHDIAGEGAAQIFRVFNAYQLALAAAALIATVIWYVVGSRKWKIGLFLLFAITTVSACLISMYIAPQIADLSQRGLTHTSEFGRAHGDSMIAYLVEAGALLAAGIMLPWME